MNLTYFIGALFVLVGVFLLVWVLILRSMHRQDDGFEPIGPAAPPPPRRSPFLRERHRRG